MAYFLRMHFFDGACFLRIVFCHFQVNVNTPITDLRSFLTHLSAVTNMKLLTTDAALGFFKYSFYGIFGNYKPNFTKL